MPTLPNLAEVLIEQALAGSDDDSKDPKEARVVKVPLSDNVHVVGVKDPAVKDGKEYDIDVDVVGLMYGWDLEKVMKEKASAKSTYSFPGTVALAPNDPAKTDDQNTITLQPPELIKLDCGYWGSYLHGGLRQRYRHFGLILGAWVWQCELVPSDSAGTNSTSLPDDIEKHIPKGPSAVRTFFQEVQKTYFSVKINAFAQAMSSPATEQLDPDTLVFILPDLHLPERWPDEPDPSKLVRSSAERFALQEQLLACQHAPGWKKLKDMTTDLQNDIQKHLEDLIDNGGSKTWTITPNPKKPVKFTYTADQFLAELAFVDRRIKAASTWFYPEGLTQGERMTSPKTAAPLAPLTGNPGPAIDLINLLNVLTIVQNTDKVAVVQLGDLTEMWSGREFLYYYFPTCDSDLGVKAFAGLEASALYTGDDFQFRRDAGWRDPTDPSASGFKHYVYDPMHSWDLLQRHATGNYIGNDPKYKTMESFLIDIGKRYHKDIDSYTQTAVTMLGFGPADDTLTETGTGIVGRLSTLLGQRFNNVYNFCLPLPLSKNLPGDQATGFDQGVAALKKIEGGAFLQRYKRDGIGSDEHAWSEKNRIMWKQNAKAEDNGEFFWNRMILDLLSTLEFSNIHGNHDGYRSDPLLSGGMNSSFTAVETINSIPSGFTGIWFEHGHRWDEYNRDGRIYGAGMTNLVYYQFDDMLFLDATKELLLKPSEQNGEQAGAAQWYRIVSFADAAQKKGFDYVPTFAIYVSGHTHCADLVRFKFEVPVPPKKSDPPTSFLGKAWAKTKDVASKGYDKALSAAGNH